MVDRLIQGVEKVAASLLACVTILTFVSVALRYFFRWSIPDAYDIGRNLLGILIFWGIALSGYRGGHITVDLLWSALSAPRRRIVDLFATVFTLLCMAVFAWMMGEKAIGTRASGEATYDLNLPLWPFQALAWAGLAAAVLLLLVRLLRLDPLNGPRP
jgi:TRAP-type transport system small permease protein